MQSKTVFISNNTLQDLKPDAQNPIESWHSWAATDVGKQRKRNEDAVLNKPESGLWVIADGMGGHEAGDVASQLVVDSLDEVFCAADDLESCIAKVIHCLQAVNTDLRGLAEQSKHNSIIGSTVVVFIAQQHRCAVLWAGDSRLYRLRNKKLQQLTQDHCPDYGDVADEWSVKISNELTRAVGADEELELDCEITDVCEGDLFLLCSDGLDREVSAKEIEQILLTHQNENVVNSLIDLTLQRGAHDNVSVVLAMPVKTG